MIQVTTIKREHLSAHDLGKISCAHKFFVRSSFFLYQQQQKKTNTKAKQKNNNKKTNKTKGNNDVIHYNWLKKKIERKSVGESRHGPPSIWSYCPPKKYKGVALTL